MALDEKNRREQAREALLTVARAPAKASHTAEVLALLPEIEQALDAGATRAEVFDSLCEAGAWTATFAAFKAALQRARQRRARLQAPRASAGYGSSRRGRGGAEAPNGPDGKPGKETPGKWDFELKPKQFKHNPSADDDVFN